MQLCISNETETFVRAARSLNNDHMYVPVLHGVDMKIISQAKI